MVGCGRIITGRAVACISLLAGCYRLGGDILLHWHVCRIVRHPTDLVRLVGLHLFPCGIIGVARSTISRVNLVLGYLGTVR